MITIEARPHYCDRGRWLAKLFAGGEFAMEIDASDGWPRYYFDLHSAMRECEAWLDFRIKKKAKAAPPTNPGR